MKLSVENSGLVPALMVTLFRSFGLMDVSSLAFPRVGTAILSSTVLKKMRLLRIGCAMLALLAANLTINSKLLHLVELAAPGKE